MHGSRQLEPYEQSKVPDNVRSVTRGRRGTSILDGYHRIYAIGGKAQLCDRKPGGVGVVFFTTVPSVVEHRDGVQNSVSPVCSGTPEPGRTAHS